MTRDILAKTLTDLNAACGPPPRLGATGLMKDCHRLCDVPLGRLLPADLRLLIGQSIGLRWLVPLAIQLVEVDPLLEADFYPGDLLAGLLRIGPAYWATQLEGLGRVEACLERASLQLSDDHGVSRAALREAVSAGGLKAPPRL